MLACMKGISSFGAIIILVVGIGMTAVTIYGYTHSEIFLDDTSSRNVILGIMIAADVLVILSAILGIWGLKKGNALLICIFQIFVVIFLIIFFSLGIAAEVLPGKFFEGNCTTSDNPTINIANNVYNYSQNYFCKFGCPCSLSTATIMSKYQAADQISLLNPFNYIRSDTGVNSTKDCQSAVKNFTDEQKRMAVALSSMQDILSCSGWCPQTQNLFYRFSNVNNGKPNGYCYDVLKDEVSRYGGLIGLASFLTAGFLLLITIINICICCHPSRKGLKLTDRFVYMRNGQYTTL